LILKNQFLGKIGMSVDEQNFNVSVSEDNFVMESCLEHYDMGEEARGVGYRTKTTSSLYRGWYALTDDHEGQQCIRMSGLDRNEEVESVEVYTLKWSEEGAVEVIVVAEGARPSERVRNLMIASFMEFFEKPDGFFVQDEYVNIGPMVEQEPSEYSPSTAVEMVFTFCRKNEPADEFEYIFSYRFDGEGENETHLLSHNPDYSRMDIEM
jgi:hypothetical protein